MDAPRGEHLGGFAVWCQPYDAVTVATVLISCSTAGNPVGVAVISAPEPSVRLFGTCPAEFKHLTGRLDCTAQWAGFPYSAVNSNNYVP